MVEAGRLLLDSAVLCSQNGSQVNKSRRLNLKMMLYFVSRPDNICIKPVSWNMRMIQTEISSPIPVPGSKHWLHISPLLTSSLSPKLLHIRTLIMSIMS